MSDTETPDFSTVFSLRSERLWLRAFTAWHAAHPDYRRWLCDIPTMQLIDRLEYLKPLDSAEVDRYVAMLAESDTDIFFAIHEAKSDRFIGTARLHSIDWRVGIAQVGILIGAGAARGQGYSTEVVATLCDYAFMTLSLHKLAADVAAMNIPMQRCFERVGFAKEGHLRDHMLFEGKRADRILYGLRATDRETARG